MPGPLAALLLAACSLVALATPARAAERPRLVVLVVVDQLARHRASAALPGGLGRLLREGRVFQDAALEHAITETCPGHATMLTGTNPGRAGIPGNLLFDGGRPVYCVSERVAPGADVHAAFARAGILGIPEPSSAEKLPDALRSPALLSVRTLGDLLGPSRRVFTVSAKDRTAITLGGQRPTLAVWLHPEAGFTTSRYYASALPSWLAELDRERGLAPFAADRFPEAWSYAGGDPAALRDDEPSESGAFGRTSPHPVRGATLAETHARLLRTPLVDALTLDVARAMVERESLGTGPADLLAISLSSNDYVGHAYGPDSQEAAAALRELDRQLDAFLRFLEARVGRDGLLVVLTGDHGVAPIPEVAIELGASECRIPGGRASSDRWKQLVAAAARDACRTADAPRVEWDWNASFELDPALWARCKAARRDALAAMAAALGRERGVVHVWTAAELEGPAKDCAGWCRFYRNSFHPERSGDLTVQLDPGCQLGPEDPRHASPYATGHGTPYGYDRAVPLVFWGAGVAPGIVRGRARTIDIAPTLARRLGVPPLPEWEGRALPLE